MADAAFAVSGAHLYLHYESAENSINRRNVIVSGNGC
jgi:hypothetical protein